MYHTIPKTLQTLKSFNHLHRHRHYYYYQVCNNTLRNYYSSLTSTSLIKPFSFVKNYNTLTYAPTNDFQTPNENHKSLDFSETNSKFRQNPTRVYDQSYNTNVNNEKPNEKERLDGTTEELDLFCKARKLKEAVEVLGLLERNKVSVDINRYMLLMNECGETKAIEEGRKVHEYLVKSVSSIDVWICNKIMEMYGKCGSMEDALNVFDKMPQRNVTSWDMMITWLAKNGHGEDAIDMFSDFKENGFKPESQMFFGVFAACGVVGDMKEGLLHFESMSKDYDIVPSMDHYKSIVDMLGSSGYLNEALHFIEKMPMEPSAEIWGTMMNNCRIHGDTELGDCCAEFIELLDPSRLDEQSKAGLIPIKASDIAKENEKKMLSHLDPLVRQKVYSQLRFLKLAMKEFGDVHATKFVLHHADQESKKAARISHTEILGLSFALLSTPARSPVQILKTLRVCGDCHNALKIISNIVGRVIIVRAQYGRWFHRFEDGECSCGDHW